jgi:hypothetical protein
MATPLVPWYDINFATLDDWRKNCYDFDYFEFYRRTEQYPPTKDTLAWFMSEHVSLARLCTAQEMADLQPEGKGMTSVGMCQPGDIGKWNIYVLSGQSIQEQRVTFMHEAFHGFYRAYGTSRNRQFLGYMRREPRLPKGLTPSQFQEIQREYWTEQRIEKLSQTFCEQNEAYVLDALQDVSRL